MIKKLRISGAFLYPNGGNVEPASSARAAFHTRMIGMQSPPALHAPLAADLPESACSHSMCMSGKTAFSHFPIPSEGVWGFAPMSYPRPLPFRTQMLGAQNLPAPPAPLAAKHVPCAACPRALFPHHPFYKARGAGFAPLFTLALGSLLSIVLRPKRALRRGSKFRSARCPQNTAQYPAHRRNHSPKKAAIGR